MPHHPKHEPSNYLRHAALAGTVAVATLGVISAPAANALVVSVTDPVDPPRWTDIRSVVYRNGETAAGVSVHVADLQRKGTLTTVIAAPDSDVAYVATVWARSDGTIGKRLEYVTDTGRDTRSCGFSATWAITANVITVSVPHRCLYFGRFLSRHYFQSTFKVGASQDYARSVNLGRGDSPGCATIVEMGNVHNGQLLPKVHARLDTSGRFGDGGAGGYSRVYPACDGGRSWFIEYDGWTKKVIGKGRVGT